MVIIQIILAALIIPLVLGPLPHFFLFASGGPDVVLVVAWLFTWLAGRGAGLRWALIAGLILDFAGFRWFGYWTLLLLTSVLVIDWLKTRFFDVSSVIQALVVLLISYLLVIAVESVVGWSFNWWYAVVGAISTVLVGAITYYVLAIRFRLFSQWVGKRL